MSADNNNTFKKSDRISTSDFGDLKTFLKYCSNEIIEGLFKNHKIRFTQPWALNDPLEFNPILRFKNNGQNYVRYLFDGIMFPSEEQRLRLRLIEPQINKFGILSLTKVPDSFDMWGQYANGHKGFLIEFKSDFNKHLCMLSREGKEYPIKKVTYVDKYAVDIDLLTDTRSNISLEQFNEELFYKKVSRWQDEVEYRLVRSLIDYPGYHPLKDTPHRDEKTYLFDFSLDCIESITFGVCMSVEDKKSIMSLCEGSEIRFLQAIMSREEKDTAGFSGKVYIFPEDDWPGSLLDMLPFSFVFQKSDIDHRKEIVKINRLSDLPYYEGLEEWVKELYRIKKAKKKGNTER